MHIKTSSVLRRPTARAEEDSHEDWQAYAFPAPSGGSGDPDRLRLKWPVHDPGVQGAKPSNFQINY